MKPTPEQAKWLKARGVNPATVSDCPKCGVCAGSDHHWLYDGRKMVCKHCDATRPVNDEDL